MKKLLLIAGLMVAGAQAKDMTGQFGIGGSSTLGGTQGINLRTQVSPLLSFDLTLEFAHTSYADDNEDADTDFGGALTGFFHVADFGPTNFMVGLGLNLGTDSDLDGMNTLVEIPMRVELLVADHLSFHTQAGLVVDFMQAGNDVGPVEHESDLTIRTATNLLSSAGFTFYF